MVETLLRQAFSAQQQGAREEAETHYLAALARAPKHTQALHGLGLLYAAQQRYWDAIPLLDEALRLNPGDAAVRDALATAFFQVGHIDAALYCLRLGLQQNPADILLSHNLAGILQMICQEEEARAVYVELLKHTDNSAARLRMATMVNPVSASEGYIRRRRAEISADLEALQQTKLHMQKPELEYRSSNFYLAYHGEDNVGIQRATAALLLKACPSLAYRASHCDSAIKRKGKLKLGILSAFLHRHTMGKFLDGLVERWSSKADLVMFRTLAVEDECSAALRRQARVVDLPLDLPRAREMIAAQTPDVLFYPDVGMDPFTQFLSFARLAPLQAMSWGHPDTSGIPNMDAFISSEMLEGERAQDHYSEKLVKLSSLPVVYKKPAAVKTLPRAHFNLPENKRLYLCPQNVCKFHPAFDVILAEILRKDEQGELLVIRGVFDAWTQTLAARLQKAMPDVAGRIRFITAVPEREFGALLHCADAVLDTPYFGGGTSSYEAFAAGVPVVTWPGTYMRSRVTAALYKKMGMYGLIARDGEHYVTLALKLAQDKVWHERMKEEIARLAGALFEEQSAADAMLEYFISAREEFR